MFTVKQVLKDPVNPHALQTKLHEATEVSNFTTEIRTDDDKIELVPTLGFTRPDGLWATIDRGTVYVMNLNGKTISTFHLIDPVIH